MGEQKYLARLKNAIESSEDYEKIASGCFHNYLSIQVHDPSFDKVNKVSEWLGFYDSLNHNIHHKQEFELLPYVSYCLTSFYTFCSSIRKPEIEFPKREFEVNTILFHLWKNKRIMIYDL